MRFGDTLACLLLASGLCLGMLLLLELGRRLGKHRLASDPEGARAGLGAVEGSLFGLLGLLIAFTFGGAATRFDIRRDLIVQEANAISTAWARLDMLPDPSRSTLRDLFRRYLDSRLEAYRLVPNLEAAMQELAKSSKLHQEIWTIASTVCRTDEGRAMGMLVLPPINGMSDIANTRTRSSFHHPPRVIFGMLFLLSLGCSFLAGYGMAAGRKRSWAHMIGFAVITAIAVYVILDLEYPRLGLIRVDAADQALNELRQSMQ